MKSHLDAISGPFFFKSHRQEDLDNGHETKVFINDDNGKTLGFCGSAEIKYSYVVIFLQRFKILDRFSGGMNPKLKVLLLFFKTKIATTYKR